MTAYFLDGSAAVKLYAWEKGSEELARRAAGGFNELIVLGLTSIEIMSTFYERVDAGDLSSEDAERAAEAIQRDLRSTLWVVELTRDILDQALDLARRHRLGSQSVQLAAALATDRARTAAKLGAVTLVTADEKLKHAAEAEGMVVEDSSVWAW